MKTMHVLALVLVLGIFSGCESQIEGNNQHSKQIKDLQDQLIAQKQKTTIAFSRISSNPIGLSALQDFFLTSEQLFNDIVDVGYSECIKSCSGITETENKNKCNAKCAERFKELPFLGVTP